eukprot:5171586-Amphidinium_carterae.1
MILLEEGNPPSTPRHKKVDQNGWIAPPTRVDSLSGCFVHERLQKEKPSGRSGCSMKGESASRGVTKCVGS